MPDECVVPIVGESGIVEARQQGRRMALDLGMPTTSAIQVATAISEVARNILTYAGRGEIALRTRQEGAHRAVEIVAEDDGPGIDDLAAAMIDGYSTQGGLGLGLPGAKRLMDEFEIVSEVGHGTRVRMVKWHR